MLASFALTQLIAAGGVAGLAIVYWAFRRLHFGAREALVRLLGLNTYVYLVFALIGFAAGIAALVTGAAPLPMSLCWIVAVPLLLVAARWFTAALAGWPAGRATRAAGCGAAWRWGSRPPGGCGARVSDAAGARHRAVGALLLGGGHREPVGRAARGGRRGRPRGRW